MGDYVILPEKNYVQGSYRISGLRFEDIFAIKKWRNEQIHVLRQKNYLTDEDQIRYYEQVVKPTFEMEQPPIMLFSYFEHDVLIGYGGLVYLDWTHMRAELSFLVDTERTKNDKLYESDFRHFIRLMKRVAFEELKLNRLHGETYDLRPKHVAIMESEGFRLEGRMKQHIWVEGRYVDALIHGYLKEYYDAEKGSGSA
jgi:RimJ/RimL family protein N-acetyltransferase